MTKANNKRAKSTDHDKLTANQWFRYSDLVTHFVAVTSSQSEGLGKMALGIVNILRIALLSQSALLAVSLFAVSLLRSVVVDPITNELAAFMLPTASSTTLTHSFRTETQK